MKRGECEKILEHVVGHRNCVHNPIYICDLCIKWFNVASEKQECEYFIKYNYRIEGNTCGSNSQALVRAKDAEEAIEKAKGEFYNTYSAWEVTDIKKL